MSERPSASPRSSDHRRASRKRKRRETIAPTPIVVVLLGLLIIGPALAVGAVHRIPFLITQYGCALLIAASTWLYLRARRELNPATALSLPLLFLLLPALQSIPLPAAFHAWIDPKGVDLLALAGLTGPLPLSLDPPATILYFARAAGALIIAFAAFSLSSGRRYRQIPTALVGATGLLALLVALGHRGLGETKIYGQFTSAGGLLLGPLINPNHQAELYSLSAFATLAVAYGARDRDHRRGLKILAGILVAAAIATLSRGTTLALAAGGLTFFALRPRLEEGETRGGKTYAMFLLGALFIAGVTLAFKGEDIIPELLGTTGAKEVKLQVWWDALSIFHAHPMGIGFGAFSRVYPIYQTILAPVRFEFAENQFLGFLLEGGIPGVVLLLGALIVSLRLFLRHRRSDSVEAALLAALAAVLVHNAVDFGLEVPGVLYPFLAILGTLFGRLSSPSPIADSSTQPTGETKPQRLWTKALVPILAFTAIPGSIYLLSRPAQRDFDSLLRQTPDSKIELLEAAAQAHPTDSYYVFWRAMLEPNRTMVGAQHRLRWLNRAMILCPTCMDAHWETARLLWRIGKKPQALGEYRLIARHAEGNLFPVIYELFKAGAQSDQLENFATVDNRLPLANYFIDLGLFPSAHVLLNREADRPEAEDDVLRAKLALAENRLDIAQQQASQALKLTPHDPRPALIAAECAIRANQPDNALDILRASLRLNHLHVDLTRKLLAILSSTDQYETIEHTISDLRSALVHVGLPTFEANLASANLYMRRGIYRKAISEYQAALAQRPDDIGLRLALANAAEQSGNTSIAQDAYHEVLRRSPENPQARAALSRTTRDKKRLDAILQQSPEKTLEELR